MEESAAIKGANVGINEDYFEQVCTSFPVLKEMRQQQKTVVGSRFESFLSIFQKLRELKYEPISDKRYEYLFSIVEMGNFVDTMKLGKESPEFFATIKTYRNIVSDGFHAFSSEMSDRVVLAFISLLRTFNDQKALEGFKDSFQRVARDRNTHTFLTEGNADEQRIKIVKLLSQIKYFFEKVKLFVEKGNLDAASLAYIAGATCARNFTWFYCEKEKDARGLKTLSLTLCKSFFSAEQFSHIEKLLTAAEELVGNRKLLFAHQYSEEKKRDAEEFLTGTFLASYQEVFVDGLYLKLNQYLLREYRAELLQFEEGSPRAYEAEQVKKNVMEDDDIEEVEQVRGEPDLRGGKRDREDWGDPRGAGSHQRKQNDKGRPEGAPQEKGYNREDRERDRRKEAEREEREREERREREREERRREERRRDDREREERRERERKEERDRDDRERRHHGPGRRHGK